MKKGDVVLLVADNIPRGQWPLGRIIATYPDKKGQVRMVDVKTRNNTLKRPIHKLCLLEQV